ncbi:MAG: ABC transporter permease, partial [Chthoniobacterales bacterium]
MTSQYLRLFHRHVLRYLARHPLLALLNILSVALGVGVYLAVQIANHSANRAFAATIDLVAGKAELQITAPAGGLPETVFPAVAHDPGIFAATPLVRGFVSLPEFPGEYLQILGLDVFTNEPFRTFRLENFEADDFDLQSWLRDEGTVAVSESFAQLHQLKAGDVLRAQVNGEDKSLRVGFVLRGSGAGEVDAHFAAMDIGWAQELFGTRGALTSIQLQLTEPRNRAALIEALRHLLPPDAMITTPAQRG